MALDFGQVKEFAKKHPFEIGAIIVLAVIALYFLFFGGSSANANSSNSQGSLASQELAAQTQLAAIAAQTSAQTQQATIAANAQNNAQSAALYADQLAAATQEYGIYYGANAQNNATTAAADVSLAQIAAAVAENAANNSSIVDLTGLNDATTTALGNQNASVAITNSNNLVDIQKLIASENETIAGDYEGASSSSDSASEIGAIAGIAAALL